MNLTTTVLVLIISNLLFLCNDSMSQEFQGVCGGTQTGRRGTLSSPDFPSHYPLNTLCVWVLNTIDTSGKVRLKFDSFDLEPDPVCKYDYVIIRDGFSASSHMIGKFCGSSIPATITASSRSLWVEFRSDSSDRRPGFLARWQTEYAFPHETIKPSISTVEPRGDGGCDFTLRGRGGIIKSPNYPASYPTNTICTWTIKGEAEEQIELEFQTVDLEVDATCRYDYVEIRDGSDENAAFKEKFCGNTVPTLVKSTGDALHVAFFSDTTVAKTGFYATWRAVDRPGRVETTQPSQPAPTSETRECGGTIVKTNGDVYSPGYPHSYPNNVDCVWILGVTDNKLFAIGFEEFQLEGGSNCEFDFVELRDGESQSSPLLGRFCGNTAPLMIMASSNKIWLRFHSNGLLTGKGFEATWIAEDKNVQTIGGNTGALQRDSHRQPSPTKKCGHPLGLETKEIKDSQLTASSSWMSAKKYGPQQARLNNRLWPQGWVTDSKDKDPWLKIKLNGRHIITGIATQGYGNELFNEWVKSYIVSWYDQKHNGYVNYHEQGFDKVFDGNTDRDSVVRHTFKIPIHAEEVVIRPKTWQRNVGLRLELYGCPIGECIEPLGLANGAIKDNQLKSSSAWNHEPFKYGAHRARLNIASWPQGWTANDHDRFPWLQVNLQDVFIVTKIETQGYGGALNHWVKSYKLTWMDDSRIWHEYHVPRTVGESEWRTKIFHANTDKNSVTGHVLKVPIQSNVIRFWPQDRHGAVAMRAELYGCPVEKQNGETHCQRTGNRLLGQSGLNSVKNCEWQLTSESTQGNFWIHFDTFKFDNSDPTCTKDYVEIRNGYTRYAPLIGKYCGNDKPRTVKSSNGAMWLRFFVSGKSRNKVTMRYEFIPTHRPNRYEAVSSTGNCGLRTLKSIPSEQRNWPGQWPWQVALTLLGQSSPQCGGALIANRWVLTAAHCFKRFQLSSIWTVQAGVWDLQHHDGNEQQINVKAIYIHPQYDAQSHRNDMALIYLQEPATLNDRVNPICLGKFTDLKPGQICSVADWGSSKTLMDRDLRLVTNQQCKRESSYGDYVDSSMICAGFAHAKADSCYGDGGSPLMCKDDSDKWIVSGINTWGEGCGLPGKYRVYTNVALQTRWIKRVISRH